MPRRKTTDETLPEEIIAEDTAEETIGELTAEAIPEEGAEALSEQDTAAPELPLPEEEVPDILSVDLEALKEDAESVPEEPGTKPEEVENTEPPEETPGIAEDTEPEPEPQPAPRRRTSRRTVKSEDIPEASAEEQTAESNEESQPAEAPAAAPAEDERRGFYDLDFNAIDRDLSPEQRQEWNSIYASYRGRSALTGTVVGIDRHAINVRDRITGEMVRQEMYCAIVIPFRVRILIPETEMWHRDEPRPSFVLRNMSGASIDFVIIHVDREAGFAIGSRRLALNSRRYYFSTQPSMNRAGARVRCRVLAVGPRRCLVECGGYDVNLTQREMRYTAIPDLRSEYYPGQELDCIVKSFDRDGGRLTISVKETNPNPFDGAELRHPEGSRRQAVIAGKYAGGVFCNLPDGAVVMCSYSFHYDDSAFTIGDKVIVIIQRFDFGKKQIYGKIVAKW